MNRARNLIIVVFGLLEKLKGNRGGLKAKGKSIIYSGEHFK